VHSGRTRVFSPRLKAALLKWRRKRNTASLPGATMIPRSVAWTADVVGAANCCWICCEVRYAVAQMRNLNDCLARSAHQPA